MNSFSLSWSYHHSMENRRPRTGGSGNVTSKLIISSILLQQQKANTMTDEQPCLLSKAATSTSATGFKEPLEWKAPSPFKRLTHAKPPEASARAPPPRVPSTDCSFAYCMMDYIVLSKNCWSSWTRFLNHTKVQFTKLKLNWHLAFQEIRWKITAEFPQRQLQLAQQWRSFCLNPSSKSVTWSDPILIIYFPIPVSLSPMLFQESSLTWQIHFSFFPPSFLFLDFYLFQIFQPMGRIKPLLPSLWKPFYGMKCCLILESVLAQSTTVQNAQGTRFDS